MKQEIKELKRDLDEMKNLIKSSEDELNESVDELSKKVLTKSVHTLCEINDVKDYVMLVIAKEDKRLREDKDGLDERVKKLEEKMTTISSLMAITEHEHLNSNPEERDNYINAASSGGESKNLS